MVYPDLHKLPLFSILEQSGEPIALISPGPWRLVYANPVLARWLGGSQVQLRGLLLDDVFASGTLQNVVAQVEAVWLSGEEQATLTGSVLMDGTLRSVSVNLSRVHFDELNLVGMVMREIEVRPDARDSQPDRHDPLTGLPDRAFLLSRLTALFRGERSGDHQFAVLFVDLDDFKRVNDAQGHLIGDRVLREVARRLSGCVREGDHVVRFGGDEFVVLVERVAMESDVQPIISRIHSVLATPIALPQGEVTLSVSLGVAHASPNFHSPEEVLDAADRAMYAAKRSNA